MFTVFLIHGQIQFDDFIIADSRITLCRHTRFCSVSGVQNTCRLIFPCSIDKRLFLACAKTTCHFPNYIILYGKGLVRSELQSKSDKLGQSVCLYFKSLKIVLVIHALQIDHIAPFSLTFTVKCPKTAVTSGRIHNGCQLTYCAFFL